MKVIIREAKAVILNKTFDTFCNLNTNQMYNDTTTTTNYNNNNNNH